MATLEDKLSELSDVLGNMSVDYDKEEWDSLGQGLDEALGLISDLDDLFEEIKEELWKSESSISNLEELIE